MKVASQGLFTFSGRISVIVLLACAGLIPLAACSSAPSSAPVTPYNCRGAATARAVDNAATGAGAR
jgi:hypothetical protein